MEVLTDRPADRFAPGLVLYPEGGEAPLTIASATAVADGPGWRLSFREIRSRNAAEGLRDAYLEAEVDRSEALEPGAAFWHEVVGSRVLDSAGRELGTVADIYRAGVTEVYVVRGGPPGEFDLPAIRDIITTFTPERGEIVVDEAVLNLDEAAVDRPRSREPRARRPRWSRHGKGGASPEAAP